MPDILLYVMVAALTIASPGPGILLTLSNTLNYRLRRAIWGIGGVVLGMGIIGFIASSSLGVILIASPYALAVVKVVGAGYLLYLGTKLFRSQPKSLGEDSNALTPPSNNKLFTEGLVITLFNPKPIVFFMALFPQFVDNTQPVVAQFALLSAIFCLLVFIIHVLYGCFAMLVSRQLKGKTLFVILNRVAGSVFMLFGLVLGISAFV